MRKRLIGALGAASIALVTTLATSSGAMAFSGLSDKQKAHIGEYFMCQKLLLTDIATFNATEPCGGTPSRSTASLFGGKSGAAIVKEVEKDKHWHWKDKKRDKHHSRDKHNKRDKHFKNDRRDRDSHHNQCSSSSSSFSFGSPRGRSGSCNSR